MYPYIHSLFGLVHIRCVSQLCVGLNLVLQLSSSESSSVCLLHTHPGVVTMFLLSKVHPAGGALDFWTLLSCWRCPCTKKMHHFSLFFPNFCYHYRYNIIIISLLCVSPSYLNMNLRKHKFRPLRFVSPEEKTKVNSHVLQELFFSDLAR